MAMHSIETVQGEKFANFIYSDQTWKIILKNQRIIKKKDIFIESIRTWDPQNTNCSAVAGLNHWIMLKRNNVKDVI